MHGFHKYCSIWEPVYVIGTELQCEREPDNDHDVYAVSIMKRIQIVGHVPRTISMLCLVFIRNGGMIKFTVTGKHRNCICEGMEEWGGMEVACTFCFIGVESWVNKMSTLSYNTVVLYIGIMKVRGFWPQIITPKPTWYFYFQTVWEHWLGIAKPKYVFRSILNLSII